MSALITEAFPLIFSSAAHNFTARGDPATRRGYSASAPKAEAAARGRKCTAIARVHLFGRRVHFAAEAGCQQVEAARLDAAIARNLEELGYGG